MQNYLNPSAAFLIGYLLGIISSYNDWGLNFWCSVYEMPAWMAAIASGCSSWGMHCWTKYRLLGVTAHANRGIRISCMADMNCHLTDAMSFLIQDLQANCTVGAEWVTLNLMLDGMITTFSKEHCKFMNIFVVVSAYNFNTRIKPFRKPSPRFAVWWQYMQMITGFFTPTWSLFKCFIDHTREDTCRYCSFPDRLSDQNYKFSWVSDGWNLWRHHSW